MQFKDIFTFTRGTRILLVITLSVAATAIVFAWFYYRSLNLSEDPRIAEARKLMMEFEKPGVGINSIDSFYLLDSALSVFNSLPDYRNSYEVGVIFNNKCSALLIKVVYDSLAGEDVMSEVRNAARYYNDLSISVYDSWIGEWGTLDENGIEEKIRPLMKETDPSFTGFNYERIIKRRIKNIKLAQTETPRRLSVAFTNKGTLLRHSGKPDSAYYFYNRALGLWKENRVARSNISVLMGGEPVKPTVIESLFPPDRKKTDN